MTAATTTPSRRAAPRNRRAPPAGRRGAVREAGGLRPGPGDLPACAGTRGGRGRQHGRRRPLRPGRLRGADLGRRIDLEARGGGLAGGLQPGPDDLATVLLGRPAVGCRELRDQVQPQPSEGGVPVYGRLGRRIAGRVADLDQPAGTGGGHGHPHRPPTVPQPIAHEFLERQQQTLDVVVGGAGWPAAVAERRAQLQPQRTKLGQRRGSAAPDSLHREIGMRPRPVHPQPFAHEPHSGDGAAGGAGAQGWSVVVDRHRPARSSRPAPDLLRVRPQRAGYPVQSARRASPRERRCHHPMAGLPGCRRAAAHQP
jgi:hypothetical protein